MIGLRGAMLNREAADLVHHYGKAASANSWHAAQLEELFRAACDQFFAMGIDVVVTNNVRSCVTQREAVLKHERRRRLADDGPPLR